MTAYDQPVQVTPSRPRDREGSSSADVLPPVSVVMVTFNRRAALGRAITALRTQAYPAELLEFLIVDNGTSDGSTADLAAIDDPRFRIIRLDPDESPAAARNHALALASHDLVAFTDDDCQPDPDWVHALVDSFAAGVDVVQGRTVPDGSLEHPRAVSMQVESFSQLYETCNVAYRAAALRAVGGFDEQIGFIGEDIAAGWRVTEAGGQARFAHGAVVRHDVSFVDLAWRMRRARRYSCWPVLAKAHPDIRQLFFTRHLLKPLSAAYDAALVGGVVAVATRSRWPLLLVIPYAVMRRPRRGGRAGATDLAHALTFDTGVFAGLVTGSIQERSVVL
jgi:GT2 family glycosyltransferase